MEGSEGSKVPRSHGAQFLNLPPRTLPPALHSIHIDFGSSDNLVGIPRSLNFKMFSESGTSVKLEKCPTKKVRNVQHEATS